MNIIERIVLLILLARLCQQTPVLETTERMDEEFVETTTQAQVEEKTKDEIIAELQNKLSNMRRHVAAFRSKSQADAAKVQSLSDLIVAYESQIDSNAVAIEKLEADVKNLNSSVDSYRSIFIKKELEITDLQIKTRADAATIEDYSSQISNCQKQLKFSQASSCVPFGNSSSVHLLHLPGGQPFYAPCESRSTEGFGWTVIQRRLDGSVDFYRDWKEYREGFGEMSAEFFIGLDKIHRMTSNEQHELLIYYLDNSNAKTKFIRYDNFLIGNETEKYLLKSLGEKTCTERPDRSPYYGYSCPSSMERNVGMKFTTRDQDNDNFWWYNCAKKFHGAWWFDSCNKSDGNTHLNRPYVFGIISDFVQLTYVQMMIRPKRF